MFLINTFTHWDEPPRARHQVAFALSKKYSVLFIAANKIGFPNVAKVRIKNNLTVIQPYFFFDNRIRYRIKWINIIYQRWLFGKLAKEYPNIFIINFDFTATELVNFFPVQVYYCNDDYTAISKSNNPAIIYKYHERAEKSVAKNSKICIGTTMFLANKLSRYNSSVYKISLGAPDISDFNLTVNDEVLQSNYINVGFVGFLKTNDIRIINAILNNSRIKIIIIGPTDKKTIRKLSNAKNIEFKGILTGRELYKAINDFDVCIIPYDLTNSRDRSPNKLWQYLALGKPVVASRIAALRNWKFPFGFIYWANRNDEFPNLIIKAHEDNTVVLIQKRISMAMKNTWDRRMDQFLTYFHDAL